MEYLQDLEFTNIIWVFVLPLLLMLIDIVTGYINAWKSKKIDSSKMRDGIGKKCAELVYILLGVLLKLSFGIESIMYFLVIYICYMEINSIAENCDKLGFKLPPIIKEKLNNKEVDNND